MCFFWEYPQSIEGKIEGPLETHLIAVIYIPWHFQTNSRWPLQWFPWDFCPNQSLEIHFEENDVNIMWARRRYIIQVGKISIRKDTQLKKLKGSVCDNALGITRSKEGEKEKKLVTPENGQEMDLMIMNI